MIFFKTLGKIVAALIYVTGFTHHRSWSFSISSCLFLQL